MVAGVYTRRLRTRDDRNDERLATLLEDNPRSTRRAARNAISKLKGMASHDAPDSYPEDSGSDEVPTRRRRPRTRTLYLEEPEDFKPAREALRKVTRVNVRMPTRRSPHKARRQPIDDEEHSDLENDHDAHHEDEEQYDRDANEEEEELVEEEHHEDNEDHEDDEVDERDVEQNDDGDIEHNDGDNDHEDKDDLGDGHGDDDSKDDLDDELLNVVGVNGVTGRKRKHNRRELPQRSVRNRTSYREEEYEHDDFQEERIDFRSDQRRSWSRMKYSKRAANGDDAEEGLDVAVDEEDGRAGDRQVEEDDDVDHSNDSSPEVPIRRSRARQDTRDREELDQELRDLSEDAEIRAQRRYDLRRNGRSIRNTVLPQRRERRRIQRPVEASIPQIPKRRRPRRAPDSPGWNQAEAGSESSSSDDELPVVRLQPPATHRRITRTKDRVIDMVEVKSGGAPIRASAIEPIKVDLDLDWNSIGGLENHIRALKEMVFLPLMYPEVFEKFSLEAPKGVLFYGPPGTGKTLCARALAASCGSADASDESGGSGTKKPRVSFFMRNGADCLSKWVGEAERQLRQTFEAAKAHQPSIIFFDEIDGLAPVRSSRQDQVHSSIVSTLLGLMDGLESRGRIVVIGATNRIDSIDPALRRAGRFDRELIFTLPNVVARQTILEIHTKKWKPPPDTEALKEVAKRTVGYCGADIKALCSEAALRALRRRYPQVYHSNDKLVIDCDQVEVTTADFLSVMKTIVPASHRAARVHARPIPSSLTPLLEPVQLSIMSVLQKIFSQGANGCGAPNDESDEPTNEESHDGKHPNQSSLWQLLEPPAHRPRLLVSGPPGMGQKYIGPAILHALEGCTSFSIDMPSLYSDPSARCPEEVLVNAFREAARAAPAIIFLPHLSVWWETASAVLQSSLLIALRDLPPSLPVLILASTEADVSEFPDQLLDEFPDKVDLGPPSAGARLAMFEPVVGLVNTVLKRPQRTRKELEVLPKAPPVQSQPLPEDAVKRRDQEEEMWLRALRVEMRGLLERLWNDTKYKAFRSPVDPTEAPDYYDIIKNPIDLSTIWANADEGRYLTVFQIMSDIDLMVKNAIDYNPAHTEAGSQILRRAHGLVDIAHAWADNLNDEVVKRTNAIYSRRSAAAEDGKSKDANEAEAGATPADALASADVAEPVTEGPNPNCGSPPKEQTKDPAEPPNGVTTMEISNSSTGSREIQNDVHLSGRPEPRIDRVAAEVTTVAGSVAGSAARPDLASEKDLLSLREFWKNVTDGFCVEALEYGYSVVLSLLHEKRFDLDRSLVCSMLREAIDSLPEEPGVTRFQPGSTDK